MKRYLLFVLLFFISFLFKSDVFALSAECTQEEQLRLRQLANATDISYEFYEDEDMEDYGYIVRISGFSEDFYVYNNRSGYYFSYNGNSIVENSSFPPAGTYELNFYASEKGVCNGYLILTKIINLPTYNYYYKNPLCKGHETYTLCRKFNGFAIISYNEFVEKMTQYIKSLEKDESPNNIEEPKGKLKTFWDSLINFVTNNYIIFLIAIILLGTSGIIFILIKKRRSIL